MDFVDEFIDEALAQEMPKLKNIMKYMAEEARKDIYDKTIQLLDAYYLSYKQPPRKYVRVDDYFARHKLDKNGRKHNQGGHLAAMSRREMLRKNDKSLRDAVIAMKNDESASYLTEVENGYSAGIVFSEDYFDDMMYHFNAHPYDPIDPDGELIKPKINEWDIVNNFLFSNQDGKGNWKLRSPSADTELNAFINNYDNRMDKHYKVAYDKFRNK